MQLLYSVVTSLVIAAAPASETRWQAQQPYRAIYQLHVANDANQAESANTRGRQRVVHVPIDFAAYIGTLGSSDHFNGHSLRVEAVDGSGRSAGHLPYRWEHRYSSVDHTYSSAGNLAITITDPTTTKIAVYFSSKSEKSDDASHMPPIGDGDTLREQWNHSTTLAATACYPAVVDLDSDGRRDLVGSDRYGSGSRVAWFRNIGTDNAPAFSEKETFPLETNDGKTISNPNRGWLLTVAVADWDGDGKRDLLVGGWCRYLNFHKNVGTDSQPVYMPGKVIFDAKVLPGLDYGPNPDTIYQGVFIEACDWDGDQKLDLLCGTYSRGHIYFLRNTGEISDHLPVLASPVALEAGAKQIDFLFHNKPSVADWDGDGDLDLMAGQYFVGDAPGPHGTVGCYYFENVGDQTHPKLAVAKQFKSSDNRYLQAGFHTEPTMVDWNRDGKIDVLVTGANPANLYLNEGSAAEPKLVRTRIPYDALDVCRGEGFAYPLAIDLDHDGTLDLIIADGYGNVLFHQGLPDLQFAKPVKITSGGREIHETGCPDGGETQLGYIKVAIADWNADGRQDLVMWTNNGLNGWQRGSLGPDGWCLKFFPGTDNLLDFGAPSEIKAAGQHIRAGYRSKPDIVDLDGDGLLDMIVNCGDGTVNGPCTIMFFKNVGTKDKWELAAGTPLMMADGRPMDARVRTAVRFADWDGDGDLDLFTGNPGGLNVRYYRNDGTKTAPKFAAMQPMKIVNESWPSHHEDGVDVVDLDRDGALDLLVGSGDTGAVHFYRRALFEPAWTAKLDSLETAVGKRITGAESPNK